MTSRTRETSQNRNRAQPGKAERPLPHGKTEAGARHERSAAQRAKILDGGPSEGYAGQNQLHMGATLYCVLELQMDDFGVCQAFSFLHCGRLRILC
jgi:hypothetical protein